MKARKKGDAGLFSAGKATCERTPGVYERVHDQVSEQATKPDEKSTSHGAIAQLGERLPCTQEVGGWIPPGSTITRVVVAKKSR